MKAPQAAAVQKGGAPAADRKVSPQQKREAMNKLNRIAKRAGLERTNKGVGRGYYVQNGYACFFAPQWNYRICFNYQYGYGDYQVFAWGDNARPLGHLLHRQPRGVPLQHRRLTLVPPGKHPSPLRRARCR